MTLCPHMNRLGACNFCCWSVSLWMKDFHIGHNFGIESDKSFIFTYVCLEVGPFLWYHELCLSSFKVKVKYSGKEIAIKGA